MPENLIPAMLAQIEHQQQQDEPCVDSLQKAKSLICALNFVSRNLPLPPHLLDAVSSICYDEQEGLPEPVDHAAQVEPGSAVSEISQIGSVSFFFFWKYTFDYSFFFCLSNFCEFEGF